MKSTTPFYFLLLMILMVSLPLTAQEADPLATLIPVHELQEDLAVFKENLERVHAGLYNYTSKEEMDNQFAGIHDAITAPMTSQDFYRLLLPLNRAIRNGHTHLMPNEAFDQAWREALPLLPVDVYWYEGEVYVLRNNSDVPALVVGARIDSINGEAASDVFRYFASLFPRDGYNTSFPEAITYRAFNEFYVSFKSAPAEYDLVFETPAGKQTAITVPGLKNPQIEANRKARYGEIRHWWEKSHGDPMYLELDGDVAILTIKSCDDGDLRKFAKGIRQQVNGYFKQMEAAGTQHLILDVRGNGGGNMRIAAELLRHLGTQPMKLYDDNYLITKKIEQKEYYTSNTFFLNLLGGIGLKQGPDGFYRNRAITNWVYDASYHLEMLEPLENTFKGQVYCIGDGYSFSATGIMASWLKTYTNTLFVGEEMGGNESILTAGEYVEFQMPHSGNRAIFPLVGEVVHNPRGRTGHGIKPDLPIRNSIEDLLAGHDAIMALTYEHIADQQAMRSGSTMEVKK